jgi:hypothetical protein
MEKECFRCHVTKPLGDFYAHPMMADGHLGKCKTCTKADTRARYTTKREEIRAYDAKRARDPGKREIRAARLRLHRKRHPDKNAARAAVAHALRTGALVRLPCEVCGSGTSEAHHDDYSRPLTVTWFCFRHHREHHGQRCAGTPLL